MAERITDQIVRNLALPSKGNRVTYDVEIKGFGVRATAAGARAFILNYRAEGRERRYTIGAYPDWSVAAARVEAKRLKQAIDRGGDPMGELHASRAAPTMASFAQEYLEQHAVKKRSAPDDRAMLKKHILPEFGRMKVAAVGRSDLRRLHRKITDAGTPYRANRVLALLSRMFSLAVHEYELRPDNPVIGIERNPEERRERYLTLGEIERLLQTLDHVENQHAANAVRLLLLTGARQGELLNATWDQFDLNAGLWVKPSSHTKQKKPHRVPLSDEAIGVLCDQADRAPQGRYVFPGKTPFRALTTLKSFWNRVRREAKLEDVRLHDLRHTYASLLASHGLSLPVIGALLGHTQAATTDRYAHLLDEPLRAATSQVARLVSASTQGNRSN